MSIPISKVKYRAYFSAAARGYAAIIYTYAYA